MRTSRLIAVLLVLTLCACAGVGIVATSDPLAKLLDAENLTMRQGRPLPAERLIQEAMAIYEERGDAHGLGSAHREYANLLRSPAVAKWEKVYRRDGFRDKSITFDNRFEKASEYYRKAITYYGQAAEQYRQAGKYDALVNVYFAMAWSHQSVGERGEACAYYDRTLEANSEYMRRNPSAKPYTPPGAASFSEYIETAKRRAHCP